MSSHSLRYTVNCSILFFKLTLTTHTSTLTLHDSLPI